LHQHCELTIIFPDSAFRKVRVQSYRSWNIFKCSYNFQQKGFQITERFLFVDWTALIFSKAVFGIVTISVRFNCHDRSGSGWKFHILVGVYILVGKLHPPPPRRWCPPPYDSSPHAPFEALLLPHFAFIWPFLPSISLLPFFTQVYQN
jgi:hypothetical protein